MWRAAWTQLQEVEMHPFIPVFLPRKAQSVGDDEARGHFCISVCSEFPLLWFFFCSSQRSGFSQEKRSTKKKRESFLSCQEDPIPFQDPLLGRTSRSFWIKPTDIHSTSLGYFCWESESPFQSAFGCISNTESDWKNFLETQWVHFSYFRFSFWHFLDLLS